MALDRIKEKYLAKFKEEIRQINQAAESGSWLDGITGYVALFNMDDDKYAYQFTAPDFARCIYGSTVGDNNPDSISIINDGVDTLNRVLKKCIDKPLRETITIWRDKLQARIKSATIAVSKSLSSSYTLSNLLSSGSSSSRNITSSQSVSVAKPTAYDIAKKSEFAYQVNASGVLRGKIKMEGMYYNWYGGGSCTGRIRSYSRSSNCFTDARGVNWKPDGGISGDVAGDSGASGDWKVDV